jgi:hypothetical protein
MLRGFAAGSLALIVLYVVVQQGASSKLGAASGALQQGMKRLWSPGVAGIANHSNAAQTAPPVTPTGAAHTNTTGPFYTV